jgi:hypothetical protein
MLGGGDEHAALLQAGGVAYFGHIAADGFNLEAIQVNPAKHNSGARRRRQNSHLDRRPTVQPNALTLHRAADCLFEWQVILDKQITPGNCF